MLHYISFLIVFVSLLFISGCEKKEVKNETLKIAAIEPLSGPYAAVGQDLVEQLTFYADLVNSNGGLKDGRNIEIIALDNAMKAEKTTELLRKSIDEGIRFITQGAGSNHALNIIKQLEKYNSRNPGKEVLFLNHSAVTTTFTNELCTFYHFRFDANVDMKVAALVTQLSKDQAQKFYEVHSERPFYGELVSFMSRGPIVAAILEKENAVEEFRKLIGSTNPVEAEEGTIRNLYATSMGENAVHGSDSDENAEIEGAFHFSDEEILS